MQVLYVSRHLLPTQPCDLSTIPLAPYDWEGDRAGLREQTAHEASQQLNWSSNKVAWLKTWAVCHSVVTTVSCPPKAAPDLDPGSPWLLPLAGLSRSQPKQSLESGGPYDLTKDTSGAVLWRAHPLMRTALMWRLYFCRHPVMRKWPRQYEWFFMKMKIDHIWLQKWYGGVADISREEYFKAVPRKAWWSEKKVLDVCVTWKPFERCCQTAIDCCLFVRGSIAALSILQQNESGSPGTPVLAGDWSGHLQMPRSHRDFT